MESTISLDLLTKIGALVSMGDGREGPLDLLDPAVLNAAVWDSLVGKQSVNILPEVIQASARIRASACASDSIKKHVSASCAHLILALVDQAVARGSVAFHFTLASIRPAGGPDPSSGAMDDSDLAASLAAIHAALESRKSDPDLQLLLLDLAGRIVGACGPSACGQKASAPASRSLASKALAALHLNAAAGVDGSEALAAVACDVITACGPVAGEPTWKMAEQLVAVAEETAALAEAHDSASEASSTLFSLAATLAASVAALLAHPVCSGPQGAEKDEAIAADLALRLRCLVALAAKATQPAPALGTVGPVAAEGNAAATTPGAALVDQWPTALESLARGAEAKCSSAAARCSAAASKALVAVLETCWREGREQLVISAASSLGTHVTCGIFLWNSTAAAEQQALVLTLGALGAALLEAFGEPSPEADKVRRLTLPAINELLLHTSDEAVPLEVVRAASLALAEMGVASARSRTPSLFPLVVDILCQTWCDPECTPKARRAVRAGLEKLARGVVTTGAASGEHQQLLALRFLQTFVEAAAYMPPSALPSRLKPKARSAAAAPATPSTFSAGDLVGLLPSIALALGNGDCTKVLPLFREMRSLVNKGWQGEIHIAPRVEEPQAASQIKLFRLFWIYAAVLHFDSPAASQWLHVIAAGTPPLLSVPGPKLLEMEMEVEERILRLFLGPSSESSAYASKDGADLPKYMVALSKGNRAGEGQKVRDIIAKELLAEAQKYSSALNPSTLASASVGLGTLAMQLATVKAANARVGAGLVDPTFTPVHAAYAYMAVAQARDAAFVRVLADSAFHHTLSIVLQIQPGSGVDPQTVLRNLALLIIGHLQQPQWEEQGHELIALGNPSAIHTVSSNNIAALEAISQLRSSPEATAAATRPGKLGPLEMIQTSETFLGQLLSRAPALLYDPHCLRAMLNALAIEQGKHSGGNAQRQVPGSVMPWLRAWLREASRCAPKVLEAALHAALGSGLAAPPLASSEAHRVGRAAPSSMHHLSQVSMVLEAASQSLAGVLVQELNAVSLHSAPLLWARGGIEKHHARALGTLAPTKEDRQASHSASGGVKGKGDASSALARTLQAETVSLLSLRSQVLGEAAGLRVGLSAGARAEDDSGAAAVTRRILSQSSEAAAHLEGGDAEAAAKAAAALGRSALLGCALLAETPFETVLTSPVVSQLLSAVIWAPVQSSSPAATADASLGWHWVVAAHGDAVRHVAMEAARAFLWTCSQGWGLYASDASLPPADFGPDGDVSTGAKVGRILRQVQLQKELIGFLGEIVSAVGLGGDEGAGSILDTVLYATSTVLTGLLTPAGGGEPEPLAFGRHPAALGLRLLVLNLAAQCAAAKALRAAGPGLVPRTFNTVLRAEIVAGWEPFASPLLDSGLMTFARATAVLSHWSYQEAREELELPVLSIRALSHMLRLPDPVAVSGSSAASSTKARVTLAQRMSLLAFLCVMESDRKTVFLDPVLALQIRPADYLGSLEHPPLKVTAVPLKANKVTDAQWAAWAATAWSIDPRLALTLVHRFPAAEPMRKIVAASVLGAADVDARLTAHPDGVIPILVAALRDPSSAAKYASRATALLAAMKPIGLEGSLALLDVEIELMRTGLDATKGKKKPAAASPSANGRQGSVRGPAWLAVKAYVMRCLAACDPERVSFFLPQLVQALRSECDAESDRQIEDFLIAAAAKSPLFAHRLIWALETEARPPEEAFNPEIKRSGWEPPKDTGLWAKMEEVRRRVLSTLPSAGLAYVDREMKWLEGITSISGKMKKVEAENRKEEIANILRRHNEATEVAAASRTPEDGMLYLPVKPKMKVLRAIPESGAVMQSAAKFPVLVAFEVTASGAVAAEDGGGGASMDGAQEAPYIPAALAETDGAVKMVAGLVRTARSASDARALADHLLGRLSCARLRGPRVRGLQTLLEPAYAASVRPVGVAERRIQDQLSSLDSQADATSGGIARNDPELREMQGLTSRLGRATSVQACIFKVGDDCRQDVLALQVIAMLRSAFQRSGLDLFLYPYGVVPTGYERGVIEVVPNTKSRSSLGETADGGLLDIFVRQFGAPGSPRFEAARHNFIRSLAGYAVASYLLQSKDRHNGNILVDSQGHLIHIDFGFILEISPGGNLGFETASFKLSHEMTQLVDPGRSKKSENFNEFMRMVIKGFLAARGVAEEIIHCVSLMGASGLPCFGYGKPLEHLRDRFKLDCTERQAARFMRSVVLDAYDKWSTRGYDVIQRLQQGILA